MLRAVRSAGVIIALGVAALLAFAGTRDSAQPAQAAASTGDAVGLAVATSDLVGRINDVDGINRVTGAYVPDIGLVLTIEIEQLAVQDIRGFAAGLLDDESDMTGRLGEAESVIFLLDIAQPERITRLLAVAPDAARDGTTPALREAPATSTAPLQPTFEPLPQD